MLQFVFSFGCGGGGEYTYSVHEFIQGFKYVIDIEDL